jgi:hypothetical protein
MKIKITESQLRHITEDYKMSSPRAKSIDKIHSKLNNPDVSVGLGSGKSFREIWKEKDDEKKRRKEIGIEKRKETWKKKNEKSRLEKEKEEQKKKLISRIKFFEYEEYRDWFKKISNRAEEIEKESKEKKLYRNTQEQLRREGWYEERKRILNDIIRRVLIQNGYEN